MLERACNCSVTARKVADRPLAYEACRLHFDLCCLLSADISWQAEDMDLLNTWHCAVLHAFRDTASSFGWEGNSSPITASAEVAREQRWMGSRNAGIPSLRKNPPLPCLLSIIGHMSPSLSHDHGGGLTGQACCFSPCRQWLPSFLLCSAPAKRCKPQHITLHILPCLSLNFTCVGHTKVLFMLSQTLFSARRVNAG